MIPAKWSPKCPPSFFFIPRALNSVMHTVSVDVLVKLQCLFVFAACTSLACNPVERSPRLSQCCTQALLLVCFHKNWMREVKSGTYKTVIFYQSLSSSVQVEPPLQTRMHTHSIFLFLRGLLLLGVMTILQSLLFLG